jgi:ABC-type uncharacterized transport system ATPase subunit
MSNYIIYYSTTAVRNEWLDMLIRYADNHRIGIVSKLLPIIGNLSVAENILLGAYYHHSLPYSEGIKMVQSDLKKYGMEHQIDSRRNNINDFEALIVKYLQVRYINPEWIVFVSPRRMYVAEYEQRFHDFLRCEELKKSVIIEHESNRGLFSDLPEYKEKDFYKWLTQDLNT